MKGKKKDWNGQECSVFTHDKEFAHHCSRRRKSVESTQIHTQNKLELERGNNFAAILFVDGGAMAIHSADVFGPKMQLQTLIDESKSKTANLGMTSVATRHKKPIIF